MHGQAMELGRFTNEAAKTANSKELVAGLGLTIFASSDQMDSRQEERRRERLDLFILIVALSSSVKI
jgi:hypothetical protein